MASLSIAELVRMQRTSPDFAEFCVTNVANLRYAFLFLLSAPGRAEYCAELARQSAADSAARDLHSAVVDQFGGADGVRAAIAALSEGGSAASAVGAAASSAARKRGRAEGSDEADGQPGPPGEARAAAGRRREREGEREECAFAAALLPLPAEPSEAGGAFVGPHPAFRFPDGAGRAELTRHFTAVVSLAKERQRAGGDRGPPPSPDRRASRMQAAIDAAAAFVSHHRTRTEHAMYLLLCAMAGGGPPSADPSNTAASNAAATSDPGEAAAPPLSLLATPRLALFFVAAGVVFRHCDDGPLWSAAQRDLMVRQLRCHRPTLAAASHAADGDRGQGSPADGDPGVAATMPYQPVFDRYLPRIVAHTLRGRPMRRQLRHSVAHEREDTEDVAAVAAQVERWVGAGVVSPAAAADMQRLCRRWSEAGEEEGDGDAAAEV